MLMAIAARKQTIIISPVPLMLSLMDHLRYHRYHQNQVGMDWIQFAFLWQILNVGYVYLFITYASQHLLS